MESGQYFKDCILEEVPEQVSENANNVQSLSQSGIEIVVEMCTPDFHVDDCTCFEKRAEEIKQMQAKLEKERQNYEMKKELRRKEREEKEKKQKEFEQLEQIITKTSNLWHEKNTKRKQLEDEIINLNKECDNLYDKYYELTEKYNKLSNTKKYKIPNTIKSDRYLKNLVNTFTNLYGDSTNYIDYNTITPFYYFYKY